MQYFAGPWLRISLSHISRLFAGKDLGLGIPLVFTLKSVHTLDLNKEPILSGTVLSSF